MSLFLFLCSNRLRAALLLLACLITPVSQPPALAQQPASVKASGEAFSFGVIGDIPSGNAEEDAVAAALRAMHLADARFIVHTGNFKSADESCTDALYQRRRVLIERTQLPLVLLPGANEWIACGSGLQPYDPDERLARLRELFFSSDEALGAPGFRLIRQSEMARFRGYPENVRWQIGNILFVGLNLPGRNNNYRIEAGRNGEFEDRLIANRTWLQRAFRLAEARKLQGIVIAVSGDPDFTRIIQRPDRSERDRDGYYEFKLLLRDLTAQYNGQVLLIHGGPRGYRHDRPLTGNNGKPLPNFIRVQVNASPVTGEWVRIGVDPARPNLFSIESKAVTQEMTGNPR